MSNVPRSNVELENALNKIHNASDLRETLLATLVSQGQIVRTRDSEFNTHLVMRQPSEPSPAVTLPANPATCVRTIYPAGNNRFEIYGTSEMELDERELQIRAMFGGQR
jgi:hypothetical protein